MPPPMPWSAIKPLGSKANHPVEFMAGVMNCDLHLTDKLAVYFEEVAKGLHCRCAALRQPLASDV